ncbi:MULTISPECIES: polysaccharide pyruvyl transferase family protein [unclassified Curtobacterium]|uniref:polysaccharide pyruvyl transferase family protein n=1 Tax=unclassified Curtobacterium TaxID=257496 RepID=UPI0014048F4C|nr:MULTISPECIES: polysaccharide pyruvyl transferase family protein [unclassified Curtobacterium]
MLREQTRSSLALLHSGIAEVVLTDFPDHGNIGDSAIALGQRRFWDDAGIRLTKVNSRSTLSRSTLDTKTTVVIHGGGNVGGLYPDADQHRYRLAENLRSETLLIQEPQTVHFTSPASQESFARRFAARPNTRLAVRDHRSAVAVRDMMSKVVMSPDAVHMLGSIEAPAPIAKVVTLLRRDGESARTLVDGSDWPRDPVDLDLLRWWSNRAHQVPPLKIFFRHAPRTWMSKAERRFQRGVRFLSQGETIVTDRLHAMLIGLQMGRQVIATDNNYGKLSAYAETWLAPFGDQLHLRVAA